MEQGIRNIFPDLLDTLDEKERKTLIDKVQVVFVSHVIKKVDAYPFLRDMDPELIKIYRGPSYKYSQKAKENFL